MDETTIQSAKKFQQLLELKSHSMPYLFDKVFDNSGFFARRHSKKKLKLLKGIDEKLRLMLKSDEKVYFVTWGTDYSFLEAYFVGWMSHFISRMAVIFTTRRIILMSVNTSNQPRDLRSQLQYQRIEKVYRSFLGGSCVVRLRNKKEIIFSNLPNRDRKFIQKLIQDMSAGLSSAPAPAEAQGKEHLCPYCYEPVKEYPPSCESCKGGFKSPRKAFNLSLLFPGLGDWYLGHRGLAVLQIVGALFVWLTLLGTLLEEGQAPKEGLIVFGIIIVMMHLIDAFVTGHTAKKGIYPAKT
ncbi:MAG: hypothetical protein WC980_04195 [Candidatus Brocadiia bacterium]